MYPTTEPGSITFLTYGSQLQFIFLFVSFVYFLKMSFSSMLIFIIRASMLPPIIWSILEFICLFSVY